MGMRTKDLRARVRPIAEELVNCGFTMTDLLSIGLLFLEGKKPNEIAELRKIVNQRPDSEHSKLVKKGDETLALNIEETIQNIKYFVKFKLPTPEEKRLLDELRRELASEMPKSKKKRKARA